MPPRLRLRQAQLSVAVESAGSAPLIGKAAWERATGSTGLNSQNDYEKSKASEDRADGNVDENDSDGHEMPFCHSLADQRVLGQTAQGQDTLVNALRAPFQLPLRSKKGALTVPIAPPLLKPLHFYTPRSTPAASAAAAAASTVIDAVFASAPASSSFFFPNDPRDPAVFAHQ